MRSRVDEMRSFQGLQSHVLHKSKVDKFLLTKVAKSTVIIELKAV